MSLPSKPAKVIWEIEEELSLDHWKTVTRHYEYEDAIAYMDVLLRKVSDRTFRLIESTRVILSTTGLGLPI